MVSSDQDVIRLTDGSIECESPNDRIYKFDGIYKAMKEGLVNIIPLNIENMLLRGTSLRNTESVYGIVVFVGHDTKVMHNQIKSKCKHSQIETIMNKQICWIIILQLSFCLFGALYGTFWEKGNIDDTTDYLNLSLDPLSVLWRHWMGNAFQRFGTWILVFTNMIPISMIVTLESVQMF